jgi:hypothetical protein
VRRKKTPPSEYLLQVIDGVEGDTKIEVQNRLRSVLSEVKYVGDLKQLAERYGLHYLKSKRMRPRELAAWVVSNHPAVREAEERELWEKQEDYHIGVDFGASSDHPATLVIEELPDGSFKILSAEVGDGAK